MGDRTETISNRHGVPIFVVMNLRARPRGVAFLCHGLSDVHDTVHMQAINEAFVAAGFSTVRWDASNSWGRSGGSFWHATATNHYDDLTDVLKWARTQKWYREPFYLGGFSLGALCAGTYAERYSPKVAGLVLCSPVIAGSLVLQRYRALSRIWRRLGFIWEPGSGWPGKRYRYELVRDLMEYDLRLAADRLTMPVFLSTGSRDRLTTLRHLRSLAEALPNPPTIKLIRGATHRFEKEAHRSDLQAAVTEWLADQTSTPGLTAGGLLSSTRKNKAGRYPP